MSSCCGKSKYYDAHNERRRRKVRFGAIVAIFIGTLILLSGINVIDFSFWILFELLFAALFINNGLKIFRYPKGEYLGSLIFAAVLIIDAFNIWGLDWNFGELLLALIGSYMLSWGIMSLFRNPRFSKVRKVSSRQHISLSRPMEANTYEVELDANLSKVLLVDGQEDKGFEVNMNFDKKDFNGNVQYNMDKSKANLKVKCKAKAGVSSVLSKSRVDVELNSKPVIFLNATLDGTDTVLDFSNLNIDNATIRTNLSRLSLIPSKLRDSRIEVECEVTSLNLRVPRDVGVTIVHEGELNWSSFEELIPREEEYVSRNIEHAKVTCQLFIKSDMSKISFEWL